uniref:Mitochondrial import inner membrane translocase subunit TIM23 n=1 Tax=Ditylum brightwellii TaxID=49249 RepID=A0A6U3NTN9_9STRA|mmetsp:Transcript_17915/g.23737  ORF Transcript_17915/g.23737 Transcript_17915/m.23737 type:complete len:199 (+) Transcript_17915:117-713(+)
MSGGSSREFEGDAGAPLPDFSAANINLTTVAPALGVPRSFDEQPDYLEYDQKGRGVVVTMFANTGMSYLLGIGFGGVYGLREGLANTPSSRFKVKVNSVLNHCGKHGSRLGNTLGVLSIMYSLYEWAGDQLEVEQYTGPIQPFTPALATFMTGVTYYSRSGPRVAGLAGTIGLGAVGVTYAAYTVLGIPYGNRGYLFF